MASPLGRTWQKVLKRNPLFHVGMEIANRRKHEKALISFSKLLKATEENEKFMYEELIDKLSEAIAQIDDVRTELENTQPVIHKDLIEFKWRHILAEQPERDQKVIVRTNDGCMYFLSYPYDHKKHPWWWPMPTNPENEPW